MLKNLFYLFSRGDRRLYYSFLRKNFFSLAKRFLLLPFCKYTRQEEDFVLFGLQEKEEVFRNHDTHIIIGFAYCLKPHFCPEKRFSQKCLPNKSVCKSCPLAPFSLPQENITFFSITTVSQLASDLIELKKKHKKLLFIIAACPLSIKMFGQFAYLLNMRGVALPLQGRVCRSKKAFLLAEDGIKPSVTFFSKKQMLFLQELKKIPIYIGGFKAIF